MTDRARPARNDPRDTRFFVPRSTRFALPAEAADPRVPTILHVDMDAFYASVTLRNRPDLRDQPFLVGGAGRGVVLSANYAARSFGVSGGMPMTRARRLCPTAVILPPDYDAYAETSDGVVELLRTFTPTVEVASIDEAFLDLTGAVGERSATAIGEQIRAMVADEQGIPCSVGIGPTKFVAKLASNAAKPDGLREIPPDGVVAFLHPLPVEAMWGVGESTATALHRLGLHTVSDLAHVPVDTLRRVFGPRQGQVLSDLAWGRDPRPVINHVPERSVGSEETFGRDTDDPDTVLRELLRMSERTTSRLREAGLYARTVTVIIRFANFSQITRSATLAGPTDITEEVYERVAGIWQKLALSRPRIRKVGVRLSGLLEPERAYQQPQLTDPELGWREADRAVDAVVRKFGPHAVQRAVLTRTDRCGKEQAH